jgi:transposase
MSTHFKTFDRDTPFLFPPSVQEWLPEGHLARFVTDIVERLDTQSLDHAYSGGGSQAYHPKMMLSLLFYGYSTGIFSSRKLEQATYESIAVRYICANHHPDHDTIAHFRQRFLKDLRSLFVQLLLLAREMGVFTLGKVSLDGTKIQANASKHKALSWKRANQLEKQLKKEVAELMRRARAADRAEDKAPLDIPEELTRREERLAAIDVAKEKIRARAHERYEREQAQYDTKQAARREKEQKTGKKARGRTPQPPNDAPKDSDQVNLTDEESRIMPTSGGGFEQAYNAQAAVDMESYLITQNHLTQQTNDKQEVKPCLTELLQLPRELGRLDSIAADTGYFSQVNVEACYLNGAKPYLASRRDKHHPTLDERFAASPDPQPFLYAVDLMNNRMQTQEGKAFYAKRKSTIETVFGIIKERMGFRRFSFRGFEKVRGEWDLVCLAYNVKRLHVIAT